jgi:16S rRNA processing protein RimM
MSLSADDHSSIPMRVVVGRLGRPHGIRGEVTVEVRTDEPDMRFAPGTVLFVNGSDRRLTVDRIHWHSGRLLVTFDGITDRTAAETLRGFVVEVERAVDETPEDPEEFYDSALTGCVVEGLDGVVIGVVAEVIHLPSQDMLSVRTPDDDDVLVPFLARFVPTVDIAARRIVIDPPDGLIEQAD